MDNSKIDNIVAFIVKETIDKTSGFQYVVYKDEVEKEFNVNVDFYTGAIEMGLRFREEVADVEYLDEGFDVVLYTSYAPLYDANDYEWQ